MPFKPLGHQNPSGDLIIGMELYDFFIRQKHTITLASSLRTRWLYLKPWQYSNVFFERKRVVRSFKKTKPDIWLSYHTYYKAPDLLGPSCSRKMSIPYIVFQGIYSTKRRRKLKTLPGFLLNRRALRAAQLVFTNKKIDELNLKRLLPETRVKYVAPGLFPEQFTFDLVSRRALREKWQLGNRRIVLTTAMLRPGVKTTGVRKVIESCAELRKRGLQILLVIVGDGINRTALEMEGAKKLAGNILFLGKIPRLELYRYYSAADVFAFPGIEESLGMVYLEAQSAGLPVVAYQDWGAKDAIVDTETGLLSSIREPDQFIKNIETLLVNRDQRIAMREAAKHHIRMHHDAASNYRVINDRLQEVVLRYRSEL